MMVYKNSAKIKINILFIQNCYCLFYFFDKYEFYNIFEKLFMHCIYNKNEVMNYNNFFRLQKL